MEIELVPGGLWNIFGSVAFASARLQRMADRVAEKAVPGAPATGTVRLKTTEAVYVSALRAAAHDGVVTHREERHLGIGPKRALELREHVEAET